MRTTRPTEQTNGFTLIELSIVLVIIGLVVGGVLVGQDLIRSAAVRAQISQIEKYNTAVNTFRGKYGAVPGDMNAAAAAQFGFASRGNGPGEGDGNGIIEGVTVGGVYMNALNETATQCCGEPAMFWEDLSVAALIDGTFNRASETTGPFALSGTGISLYMPAAAIGGGNNVYAWSWNGKNYFGLTAVTLIGGAGWGTASNEALTVKQAFAIDLKVDDGLPVTGRVITLYVNGSGPLWSFTGRILGGNPGDGSQGFENGTGALAASSSTCYDNGGNINAPMTYSLAVNDGTGINCGLSFQFQ
jgi:prepilin-type N-terminal cleavage/methylation domain-containing protein